MSLESKTGTQAIRDGLTQEEVFELLGRMLFKLHAFEKLLGTCTAILVATNRDYTAKDEIDAIDDIWKMSRRTCGTLILELKKVVNVEPKFGYLLRRLLRRRNRFAHKLSWRRQFNPSLGGTALKNIPAFVLRLNADVDRAWDVFANYAEAVTRQADGDATYVHYAKLVLPFLTLKRPPQTP